MKSHIVLCVLVLAVADVLCARNPVIAAKPSPNTTIRPLTQYPPWRYRTTKSPYRTTAYPPWRYRTTTLTTPWWFVPTSTTQSPYRSTASPRWQYRTTTSRPTLSTSHPWWYVPTSTTQSPLTQYPPWRYRTTKSPYRTTAYPPWRYRTTTLTTPWWFVPTSTTQSPYRSTASPRWQYRTTTARATLSTSYPWWFVTTSTPRTTSTTSAPLWFYPSTTSRYYHWNRASTSNPWLKPWKYYRTTTSIYDWLKPRRTTVRPWWSDDFLTTRAPWSIPDKVYVPSVPTIDNDLWESFTDSPSVNNVDDNNTYDNDGHHGGLGGGIIAVIVLSVFLSVGFAALRVYLCYRRVDRLSNGSNNRRDVGQCRVLSVTALAAVPDETDSDRVRLIGVRQTRILHV